MSGDLFARNNLVSYAIGQWPGYKPSAHHRLIARHLEAVERGDIKRLMIFMPPRHGKSQLVSCYFPAWYLGRGPDRQMVTATYAQELADDFGRSVRNQIQDPLYQAIFPGVAMRPDSSAAHRFHLSGRGVYQAVGVGGPLTGRGADCLIIDDPVKNREEADSDLARTRIQSWYTSVAYTRLMPAGAIILVQTRWRHDDLAGWLLKEHAQEDWTVLELSAVDEAGEALWPDAYPIDALNKIKEAIGPRDWSALYQQRPTAAEGGILKKRWWRRWPPGKPTPKCEHVVQSYDTAYSDGDHKRSSYSARTTWGVFVQDGDNRAFASAFLLEAWHARVDYPDLRKEALKAYREYQPDRVLIEKKASGQSLIRDLRQSGLPVTEYQPDRDKVARAYAAQPLLSAGRIYVPDRRWADDVIDECATFPFGKHDDLVDTCTQALIWLKNGYRVVHPDDPTDAPPKPYTRQPAYG